MAKNIERFGYKAKVGTDSGVSVIILSILISIYSISRIIQIINKIPFEGSNIGLSNDEDSLFYIVDLRTFYYKI